VYQVCEQANSVKTSCLCHQAGQPSWSRPTRRKYQRISRAVWHRQRGASFAPLKRRAATTGGGGSWKRAHRIHSAARALAANRASAPRAGGRHAGATLSPRVDRAIPDPPSLLASAGEPDLQQQFAVSRPTFCKRLSHQQGDSTAGRVEWSKRPSARWPTRRAARAVFVGCGIFVRQPVLRSTA
jgi:hypothetical protein